jgi:hypothetical protein
MPRVPVLTVASEVRALAQPLIQQHHAHLREATILFIFTDQKRKRCDRVRLGSAGKLTALQRFLSSGMDSVELGADFVILIDSNLWPLLSATARTALVDHELCHAAVFVKDDSDKPAVWRRLAKDESKDDFDEWRYGMRGHDIEEFGEVLYRHGFWKPEAPERAFGEIVALQLKLPPDEQPAPNGTSELSAGRRRRGTKATPTEGE